MVKAAAGGGGRGIRVSHTAEELAAAIPTAMAKAKAGFGGPGLYLEAHVEKARHIEVRALGDGEVSTRWLEGPGVAAITAGSGT